MKLLAIDTSGTSCSAALLLDGQVSQRLEQAPRRHGELILSMMDELLRGPGLRVQGLDALAYGRGPGSFTGLRIAAAVVQGVAFGAGLPVVGVSTLAALAQGAQRTLGTERALCAFDARMGEVYWGAYQTDSAGMMRPRCEDMVGSPESVWVPDSNGWLGIGEGWSVYRERLNRRVGPCVGGLDARRDCEARDIAMLAADAFERGEALAAEQALPVYLRNRVTATDGA